MYILACDERGSVFRFSKSETWTYGGFIFKKSKRLNIISTWNKIKIEICGSENVELKWSHFFLENKLNPILDNSKKNLLNWALETLFEENPNIIPITTMVSKKRASDVCYRISKKGNPILDIEVLTTGSNGQFALFLKIMSCTGEMWFDQLGSIKEQKRKQDDWIKLRRNPGNKENEKMIKRIKPSIRFFDSIREPIIQIADFVSGVIWSASEGDESYLANNFENYFPDWWGNICFKN